MYQAHHRRSRPQLKAPRQIQTHRSRQGSYGRTSMLPDAQSPCKIAAARQDVTQSPSLASRRQTNLNYPRPESRVPLILRPLNRIIPPPSPSAAPGHLCLLSSLGTLCLKRGRGTLQDNVQIHRLLAIPSLSHTPCGECTRRHCNNSCASAHHQLPCSLRFSTPSSPCPLGLRSPTTSSLPRSVPFLRKSQGH